MTTYFVGGELDSVVINSPVGVSESTGAGTHPGYTRGGIRVENFSGRGVSCWMINPTTGVRAGATGSIWTHFNAWIQAANNTTISPLNWVNSAGVPVFRMLMAGAALFQSQYWNGTAWVNIGPVFNFQAENFSYAYDFNINIAVAGWIKIYINSVEVVNVSADLSAIGNIARFDITTNGGALYVAQIIIADYNTIGHTVRRRTPTGNGSNSTWNGDWNGVDEYGQSDGDGVSTNVVGVKETFAANISPASESGKVIKAVAVAVRARTDEQSVPKNIKAVIRVGTTDYESPNLAGVDQMTYGGSLAIFEKDPSTNAPWANITNVNGEFGVKSDT